MNFKINLMEHRTKMAGNMNQILVVEDNPKFYGACSMFFANHPDYHLGSKDTVSFS
jgi:hypothetical protein